MRDLRMSRGLGDVYKRQTLANKVPYCTNMSTAKVCIEGIKSLKNKEIKVTSLQDI